MLVQRCCELNTCLQRASLSVCPKRAGTDRAAVLAAVLSSPSHTEVDPSPSKLMVPAAQMDLSFLQQIRTVFMPDQ